MRKRFYTLTRDLHLYLGLFIAPFILVVCISVFSLAYAWLPGASSQPGPPRTVGNVTLPADLENLDVRARIDALQTVLARVGVSGEIGWVQYSVKQRTIEFPVVVPGREATVAIDLATRIVTVTRREPGVWDALITLHKSPGPHLAALRMNWLPMAVWRWFADGTVYLLIFVSISGIYLWAVLRSERRIGLALIGTGVLSFAGIIYAVIH